MKVGIFGYGRIGRAVHKLLTAKAPDIEVAWTYDQTDHGAPAYSLRPDLLVNTAPYTANPMALEIASRHGCGYIDFSEDTKFWRDPTRLAWAETHDAPVVPHCGIAPGIINIMGADFIARGAQDVRMYCGALPASKPLNPLHHAVTWSAAGMAREYIEPSELIMSGRYIDDYPLVRCWQEVVVRDKGADGLYHDLWFESATTSGGIGSMARTFDGKVRHLSYHTLRWHGHWEAIAPWLHYPAVLDAMLESAYRTEFDIVAVKVKTDIGNSELVIHPDPDLDLSAIELATASGGCAVLDLISQDMIGLGLTRQEDITVEAIRNTRFNVYGF